MTETPLASCSALAAMSARSCTAARKASRLSLTTARAMAATPHRKRLRPSYNSVRYTTAPGAGTKLPLEIDAKLSYILGVWTKGEFSMPATDTSGPSGSEPAPVYPPWSLPTIFVDGALNFNHSPQVVKFYFLGSTHR